jgi:RNA polymerase sigma-70 factor (ECF subfamily)
MLGSLSDSEDLVQETLLRAWRARESFEGRSTVRAWLYRIATNACLDFLASQKQRRSGATVTSAEPELGPQPHVAWLQPFPDQLLEPAGDAATPEARLEARESLELAYMVALQCLPVRQRAALILCDVLEWPAKDAADLLEQSVAALNAALQRARSTLRDQQASGFRPRTGAAPSSEEEQRLLADYVSATERCDIPALTALLREDLRFSMPPHPFRVAGRDAAVESWISGGYGNENFRDFRCIVTRANGAPAVALYRRPAGAERYRPMALDVLRIEDRLVSEIVTFDISRENEGTEAEKDSALLLAFGLPREL